MKDKNQIISEQKDFINKMKNVTLKFINSINKSEIETVILSGSVARGDFCPGEYGGMVDLIVMRTDESSATADDIFGPNQDPDIPYHCVMFENVWFEILFTDFITAEKFVKYDEPRKFSVLEGEIIYDNKNRYGKELTRINAKKTEECQTELRNKLGYIKYLISDYKKDRWYRREAFLQMNENLNTAIRNGICCLFYKNNSYAPAEDRRLYYSLSLELLPQDYEKIIYQLQNQISDNEADYKRRERLFRETVLAFIETGI